MKKTYVLDTNVLLQTPNALFAFEDNDVVIPDVVLEELDRFKRENSERGANARETARLLDALRVKGSLINGIILADGGTVRVELNYVNIVLPGSWNPTSADNRVLRICKGLKEQGKAPILVTRDTYMRIKGDILGITVQDFTSEQVAEPYSQYRGRVEAVTSNKKLDGFFEKEKLNESDVYLLAPDGGRETVELTVNEFLLIRSETNPKHSALGRFDGNNIVPLDFLDVQPFGVRARNAGQRFMQEALMRRACEAPLVIVKGVAGTAKTFYALAVGLHKLLVERDNNSFRKILVCRPNIKFDEDIGFLPGTEAEKIAPFLRPIRDNLEVLVDQDETERYRNEKELRDKVDEYFERGIITTEAIAYIRGRSIVRNWVIIDEAQNLTPKQVKGIITRVGMGTKIILIGDPEQIDHPFLDARTNGLCYAAERMKGSACCWQVTMNEDECERSVLALDAARRMADKQT